MAAEHVEIYGANFVNIIAKAVASGDLAGVAAAAGTSLEDTKSALKIWLRKRFGSENFGQVFALADFPVGFQMRLQEQHPLDENKLYITTYHNCWITRYTRPVVATGELLIVETADISAQRATSTEGIPVTQDKVEVVSKD
jgi:hypothetical protein